jgi:hypothetical protein
MPIIEYLGDLALRPLLGESAGVVLGFLRDRFSDQGRLLLEALRTAQTRAWCAFSQGDIVQVGSIHLRVES